jgi:squalene cyclase
MEDEEIRQLWAEGEDWVIKRQNNQYSHRPDQKYGNWRPGLPPGVFEMDVDTLFDE